MEQPFFILPFFILLFFVSICPKMNLHFWANLFIFASNEMKMSEIIDMKIQPFGANQQRTIGEYDGFELAYSLANLHNNKAAITKIKAFKLPTVQPYSDLQLLQADLLLAHKFLTALRSFAPLGLEEIEAYFEQLLAEESSAVSPNSDAMVSEQIYFVAAIISPDYPRLILIGNGYDSAYPNCIFLDCQEARFLGFGSIGLAHEILPEITEIGILYDVVKFAPRVFRLEQLGHILHDAEQPRAASD